MIIVSQDKEIIINFNNAQAINVHLKNKKQVCAWFNVDEDPNGNVVLGEYKTEERAKEVLQEIWNFYEIAERYECSSNNGVTIFLEKKFTYEMPKE